MLDLEVERWTVADAMELYDVARWGNGYFTVNDDGHVWFCRPRTRRGRSI